MKATPETYVFFLPDDDDEPLPFVIVSAAGIAEGRPGTAFSGRSIHSVLLVPGTEVRTHFLPLSAHSRAQAAALARERLKDVLASPSGQIHVAVGTADAAGVVPVSVVDTARMQTWLERAAKAAIDPDLVLPDYLALPPADGEEIHIHIASSRVIARGARLAFSCEAPLAELVLAGRTTRAGDFEAGLAAAVAKPLVNLRQSSFTKHAHPPLRWPDFRRAAALAAVLLLSPLLLTAAQAIRLTAGTASVESEARASAEAAAPDAENAVAYLSRMDSDLAAGDAFLARTGTLFDAVRRAGLELESLSYTAEAGLRAGVVHKSGEDIVGLRTALESSGLRVRLDATSGEPGRLSTPLFIGGMP